MKMIDDDVDNNHLRSIPSIRVSDIQEEFSSFSFSSFCF